LKSHNNPAAVRLRAEGGTSRRAQGWVLEHRYHMEQMLGRELHPWENIHHRDGNRACNDQSNLELWIKTQPSGIRLSDLVDWYQAE